MLLSVVLIICVTLVKTAESLGEWADCTGGKKCDSGLNCYAQHQYYSQCRKACPSGWQCENGGGGNPATAKPATTGQPMTANGNAKALSADYSFGFGASFDGNSRDYSHLDYATIWIGTISP